MIKAYIISLIICFIVLTITAKAANERAKREGYRRKYKASVWEKLQRCLPVFIPIFNILLVFVAIFSFETAYKGMIEKMERVEIPGGTE